MSIRITFKYVLTIDGFPVCLQFIVLFTYSAPRPAIFWLLKRVGRLSGQYWCKLAFWYMGELAQLSGMAFSQRAVKAGSTVCTTVWQIANMSEEDIVNELNRLLNDGKSEKKPNKKKYERKLLKCEKCPYSTRTSSHMKRHVMALHDNIDPFLFCGACEFSTKFKHSLDNHYKAVHLKLKLFGCQLCEYKAVEKCHLRRHAKRRHNTIIP